MEEEEEEKYMVDEAARQWEKSTQSRHIRSSRNGSFLNKAESFIRSVSVSGMLGHCGSHGEIELWREEQDIFKGLNIC